MLHNNSYSQNQKQQQQNDLNLMDKQKPISSKSVQHNLLYGKSLNTLDTLTKDYENYQEGMGICKHCAEALGIPCQPNRQITTKRRNFWHKLTNCFRTQTDDIESCPICERCAAAKRKQRTNVDANQEEEPLDEYDLEEEARKCQEKLERRRQTKIINVIRKSTEKNKNLAKKGNFKLNVKTNSHFYRDCNTTAFKDNETLLKRMTGELPTKENFLEHNFFICKHKNCQRYTPPKVYVRPSHIVIKSNNTALADALKAAKKKKKKKKKAQVVETKHRPTYYGLGSFRVLANEKLAEMPKVGSIFSTMTIEAAVDALNTINSNSKNVMIVEDDNKPTTSTNLMKKKSDKNISFMSPDKNRKSRASIRRNTQRRSTRRGSGSGKTESGSGRSSKRRSSRRKKIDNENSDNTT